MAVSPWGGALHAHSRDGTCGSCRSPLLASAPLPEGRPHCLPLRGACEAAVVIPTVQMGKWAQPFVLLAQGQRVGRGFKPRSVRYKAGVLTTMLGCGGKNAVTISVSQKGGWVMGLGILLDFLSRCCWY